MKYCVPTLLYFETEISYFPPEETLNSIRKKKYMAAVARGIDETSNAVQLNGFFLKIFYFYNLFSQSATLPVYLFLSLFFSIYIYIFLFFSDEYFSRF